LKTPPPPSPPPFPVTGEGSAWRFLACRLRLFFPFFSESSKKWVKLFLFFSSLVGETASAVFFFPFPKAAKVSMEGAGTPPLLSPPPPSRRAQVAGCKLFFFFRPGLGGFEHLFSPFLYQIAWGNAGETSFLRRESASFFLL